MSDPPFLPLYDGDLESLHPGLDSHEHAPVAFYINSVDRPRLSLNCLITGPKRTPVYYHDAVTHGIRSGGLRTLHRADTPTTPTSELIDANALCIPSNNPILTVSNKTFSFDKHEVYFRESGFKTTIRRPPGKPFATQRIFEGPPNAAEDGDAGRVYRWKREDRSRKMKRWACKDVNNGDVVAVLRRNWWRQKTKEHGVILINWKYRKQAELFLASAIVIDALLLQASKG
ncbi:hypothetical protein T439DRAFT_248565 [Meredithblackwellia eburnea MCA 4105]